MRTADNGYRLLLAVISLAVAVGLSALVWYTVPDALGQPGAATTTGLTRVQATVIQRVGCDAEVPRERVQFTLGGKQRDAAIDQCGDDAGKKLDVLVPNDLDSANPSDVVAANGGSKLPLSGNRGLALLLLVAAGASGAGYAFLVTGLLQEPGQPGSGGPAGGRPKLPKPTLPTPKLSKPKLPGKLTSSRATPQTES